MSLALLAGFAAGGCGGDSSHHVSTNFRSGNGQDGHGGLVIIWIYDAPLEDLDALSVTVTAASLVDGADRAHAVFAADRGQSDAGHRLELLSLARFAGRQPHELLAVARDVPPGSYGRVRLALANPAIVDRAGEVHRGTAVALAGGGAFEVELATPLAVTEGSVASIVIDLDVELSLRERSGGAALWDFLPAAFATATEDASSAPFNASTTVAGRVTSVAEDRTRFEIGLDGMRGVLEVVLPPLAPTSKVHALTVGDDVLVRGALQSDGLLAADRIAGGRAQRVTARIVERAAGGVSVDILVRPGQSVEGTFTVALDPGVLLTIGDSPTAPLDAIRPGSSAVAWIDPQSEVTLALDVRPRSFAGTLEQLLSNAGATAIRLLDDAGLRPLFRIDATTLVEAAGNAIPASDLRRGQRVEIVPAGSPDHAGTLTLDLELVSGAVLDAGAERLLMRADDGRRLSLEVDARCRIVLVGEDAAGAYAMPLAPEALRRGARVLARVTLTGVRSGTLFAAAVEE